MSIHPNSWKRRERNAAKLFGARRQVLSGSAGRPDRSTSDSTHPRLYIETKMRSRCFVRTLWEQTRLAASREHKTPVLALYAKDKQGALLVVHQADLEAVAAERTIAPAQPLEPSGLLQDREPFHP